MKHYELFKTSDLALCAVLCCYNYRIEEIEKTTSPRAIFCIRKDEALDNLIKDYWSHKLSVEPIAFFSYLKEIKTQIYER